MALTRKQYDKAFREHHFFAEARERMAQQRLNQQRNAISKAVRQVMARKYRHNAKQGS